MKSMELHFGVIRDKQAIHAALTESLHGGRQLAVCYNSEGKLIVKICTVTAILEDKGVTMATLHSRSTDTDSEFTLPLERIQSLYPIRDFGATSPEASPLSAWPDDPDPDL